MATELTTAPSDRTWYVVERWQEYEGEGRTNLIRSAGIAGFYIIELLNDRGLRLGVFEVPRLHDEVFHQAVTALAVAWTMLALGVLLCLRRQVFPAALKYISTGCDLVLLTALLTIADGPRSPLVVAYFLILALSTLRLSLPLVRFATAGAVTSYLVLLGYAAWFTTRDLRVPRYQQLIVLLTLALTGITLGQLVRRVRTLALDYARRSAAASGGH